MSSFKAVILSSAILAAKLVAGHGGIVRAVGSAGGESMGLGIDPNTPRDGTNRRPFQTDSTRFQGKSAGTVGETLAGGANDIESGTKAIMGMTGQSLAQVTPGGDLMMTLHQVNADGAGPYTCMINADGTAQDWENIQVTQNIDGNQRGRNRDGNMQDLPLNVQIPANQQCSGQVAGQENVCMVRCQNPARAGPFGGVVPVQMAGAAAGANNNAAAAAAGASATGVSPAAAPTTAASKAAGAGAAGAGATAKGAAKGAASKAAGAGAASKAAGAGAAKGAAAKDAKGAKAAKAAGGRGGGKNANNNKRAAFVKRIDPVTRAVEFTS